MHGPGDVIIVPGHKRNMREGGSRQKEQAQQKQRREWCRMARFHD